jgi:dipeptidyl-peptidase-4
MGDAQRVGRVGRVPIEAIGVIPQPGMALPSAFTFSADDATLTYLAAAPGATDQRLMALDVDSGATHVLAEAPGGGVREENLTPEEELRRQRARLHTSGITHYARAERSDRLMIPLLGDVHVLDGEGGSLRLLVEASDTAPSLTPALSPDGQWVAYVQDAELCVVPAVGGAPRQLTEGARGADKTHGLAEFVAQEELDRGDGFWWSPDSQWLAFEEVDESPVPIFRILHLGSEAVGTEMEEAHRYPFAGGANVDVRLGVVSREGGELVWMDLDPGHAFYLARAFWWNDGQPGAVLVNRDQTACEIVRFDLKSGTRATVLREERTPWLNLATQPLTLLQGDRFLWLSERSGFMHLHLFDRDGSLIRQVTNGAWVVDAIAGVDESAGMVYFTASREQSTESHLYAVPLDGGELRRITSEAGTHIVTLDHARRRFVDVFSALDTPPTVTLRSLEDGAVHATIHSPSDPRIEDYGLEPPEIVTLRNRVGTLLYGALYRPPAAFGPGPYPTIVHVYGGPHAQMVTNSWGRMTAALDMQYLRNQGYLLFRLDNRGSARRGLVFESPIAEHLGTVEVDDQVDGVRWLVEQGVADPARVGIFGWSYGGYMTLMCLARAPETFKVGVAGAPVTAWDGYDTAYTERYMRTPQTNPSGYADSSLLTHAANIRGDLLLVHGMLDENVHFRHTARLMNVLNRARKRYEALLFPDERHSLRFEADRIAMHERIIGFFLDHL